MLLDRVLFGLQCFQVVVLLLHDWLPMGRLNDLAAARRVHSVRALALGTAVSSLLPVIGLALSASPVAARHARGLDFYLLGAYGFLFLGELEAWWVPMLLWPQPTRAREYEQLYARTWAFLPARNGIRVNALHVLLHAATAATLVVLAARLSAGH